MRINSVSYDYNNHYLSTKPTAVNNHLSPSLVLDNNISNIYYMPQFLPNFCGHNLENNIIKKIVGKKYMGADLFTNIKGYTYDFSKIGADKLSQVKLDITKATDNEIYAYWHAYALQEAYSEGKGGTTWVRRYNCKNVPKPNAVFNSLNNPDTVHHKFKENLEILQNPGRCKSLDVPITDKDGNDILNALVFDTETTGTRSSDKIIQLASLQIKNGKILKNATFNEFINPEMPIPEAASKINGITDDMVKDKKPIQSILMDFLRNHMKKSNGILVAYNAEFDKTILNNAIREYLSSNTLMTKEEEKIMKEKESFKLLDPYKLIERIHPYLGAKKKLSNQFEWIFCKPLENAHDALADVKGTEALRKYCLYFLTKHRKDKTIPLTLREVLIFQNGGKVENIDIPFDVEDCNKLVNFSVSYPVRAMTVANYFKSYKITKEILQELSPEIGERNLQKLLQENIIDEEIGVNSKKYPITAAEMEKVISTGGFKDLQYTLKSNFKKVLSFADLTPYNGKSKQEIEELITEKSKFYFNGLIEDMHIKNTNPKDIPDGNDLPDIEIARKVMREMQGD